MADFFDDQNNMNEDEDIITLYNESTDKDENFYHLATLDVDKKWFVVLKPVEKLDDIADDEVLIYEIAEDENGNDIFVTIEDEELLDKVFNEFMAEVEKFEEDLDNADKGGDCSSCGCPSDGCGSGCGGCHGCN